MSSFMSFGTALYGKSDFNKAENSYVVTEWIILLFLPIFPLRSYRVIRGETNLKGSFVFFGVDTKYNFLKRVNLNKKQIIITYLMGLCVPIFGIWILLNYWVSWILLFIFILATLSYFFIRIFRRSI